MSDPQGGDPALPPHGRPGAWRNPVGSDPGRGRPSDWLKFFTDTSFGPPGLKRPPLPPGHLLDADQVRAGLAAAAAGGVEAATWLGHACWLLHLDGGRVLTDPFLAERASPFGFAGPRRYAPAPLDPEALPALAAVAISHNHYDHLDVPSLRRLLAVQPELVAVTAAGCAPLLRRIGFREVHALDWGETARVGRLALTAVPAVHFSARGLFDRNHTLWCGFAIASQQRKVYFAGDTGWGPVFDAAGERFGPFDLGLVPIGAYAPRALMRAVHADPEEGLRIGLAMDSRVIAAMHWGTIALTTEPAFEPPQRFRAAGQAAGLDDARLWVPRIGETRILD